MWTGLYRPRSISQRLPCVSLATTCKLGCLLPDKREGTEDQGVTWLFKVIELQVRCGRPAKPGSQGKGQAPHVAPLMDTPLPLFAPCRGPPSSLPSASLYISPARFWSSLSCQTTCKAELRTLGASAEALTTSPASGEFVEKGHQLAGLGHAC